MLQIIFLDYVKVLFKHLFVTLNQFTGLQTTVKVTVNDEQRHDYPTNNFKIDQKYRFIGFILS